MTMIVDFADGATSASPPNVAGAIQETFPLENNMGAFADIGLSFDKNVIRSAFASFEVYRQHVVGVDTLTYRQTIEVTFIFDGVSWAYSRGLSTGVDMVKDDINEFDYDVAFNIDLTTGVVGYKTSNMAGDDYEGTVIASIIRMVAV